jgi:glyoxylase-like metal-dependent hydrolase (beta-lactamase superfamily II)
LQYFGAAHTDGDALIHFEHADIVHMGDLINNRRYPYIDRTAGASIKNWIAVLEKTTKHFSKKTTFVYGHASDGFEVYGKMDDMKAGTTKEVFIKNTSIPGVTEWVGDGIQRSLVAVYDELTAK